jgi:Fe-S cluster assembly protein SufD
MAARALSDGETTILSRLPANVRAVERLLREKGLPTRRNEQWKWSDLRAAFDESIQVAIRPSIDAGAAEAAADRGDYIAMLAAAFGQSDTVQVGAGEQALRVERVGAGNLYPAASDITLAPGAQMTRVVIQPRQDGLALNAARVEVAAGAAFRQFVLAEGAKLARIETEIAAVGEGARIELHGVYLVESGLHADLTSRITHKAPGGLTRQLIKGAAKKAGRGVFQGRIEVARGAQKTDARQHHHGLLLEEGAEIDSKPELEIYADDVQCAHGNTAGALDQNALFYMRARGLPETQARAMLTEAFLMDAVPEDLPAALREEVKTRIQRWLGGAP